MVGHAPRMKKRPRTERREAERSASKLADARERLAKLEPGGTIELPITVPTASVIETRAVSLRCLRCEGELKVDEHVVVRGSGVRDVRLACRACGTRRSVYFKIVEPVLH